MSASYHPALDDPDAFVFYRYHPNLGAAIAFVIAFTITTGFHCWQCVRTKTWYFVPLVIGGFCQIVGYIGRAMSAKDQWDLGAYIMQNLLLLIAPAFFAASVYMVLGRIILVTDGERHSIISKKWLTKTFVTGDVISLLAQSGGGGYMAAGTLEALHAGEKVVIFGLFVQLAFFGFFMVVSCVFFMRISKEPTARSNDRTLGWKKHFFVLMAVSVFIFIRSAFRVVEYISGNNGYLLKHEMYLYIFDACLMLAVMVLFNVVHPSKITEKLGESYEDTYKMYLRADESV